MKIAVEQRVNVMLIAPYNVLFLLLYKALTYTLLLLYKNLPDEVDLLNNCHSFQESYETHEYFLLINFRILYVKNGFICDNRYVLQGVCGSR